MCVTKVSFAERQYSLGFINRITRIAREVFDSYRAGTFPPFYLELIFSSQKCPNDDCDILLSLI